MWGLDVGWDMNVYENDDLTKSLWQKIFRGFGFLNTLKKDGIIGHVK